MVQVRTNMNIHKRIKTLEAIVDPDEFETGAWSIHNYGDGTFSVSSARLGIQRFNSRPEMETFIKENHKGNPPGQFGFINVNFVNAQGERPIEL